MHDGLNKTILLSEALSQSHKYMISILQLHIAGVQLMLLAGI